MSNFLLFSGDFLVLMWIDSLQNCLVICFYRRVHFVSVFLFKVVFWSRYLEIQKCWEICCVAPL